MNLLELPEDLLLIIIHFVELKHINNFKISTNCVNILNNVLRQKFNIYDDEKKLILNVNSEIAVRLIHIYKYSDGFKFNNKSELFTLSTYNIMGCYFFCTVNGKFASNLENICEINGVIHYGIPYYKYILLTAIKLGRTKMVKYLIKNNVQIENYYLFEVLKTSIARGKQILILKALIENGADPYFQYNNKNLLDYAIEMDNYVVSSYLSTNYNYKN